MINTLIVRIKRADTPFMARLKKILRIIKTSSIPSVRWIHYPLYVLHTYIRDGWMHLYLKMWVTPAFVARCKSCGDRLEIYNEMPYIAGNPTIILGDDVKLESNTIASCYTFDNPTLTIGNRTRIGYDTTISCAQSVTIGDDCLISVRCFIADNNGHPLDPTERKLHKPAPVSETSPVVIGNNVWIGVGAIILKGVTIGDNCIIGANQVIYKSLTSNTLVGPKGTLLGYPQYLAKKKVGK